MVPDTLWRAVVDDPDIIGSDLEILEIETTY